MSEPFSLPRQQRRPHGDSRATADDLTWMENRIMAALEDAVAALQQAISDANSRFTNTAELERAVNEERARYEALVASEEAEDVQQNQDLVDAKARTDELIANMAALPEQLSAMADQVNQLGTAAAQTTGDQAVTADAAPAPDAGTADTAAAPDAGTPDSSQIETTAPTDNTTATLTEVQPDAPTPGDTPADVGTTAAPADADNAGTADVAPTDTGAAEAQVADEPAPGPSAVDNANQNPDTSSDPTDVSNMRPNL